MNYIHHGCVLKHSTGTNVIIGFNKKCFNPTNNFFWKDPKEIISAVKTRSQLRKTANCTLQDYR